MKEIKNEEIVKEFLEYSTEGYAGGESGLRCTDCDRKYSGTASIVQLCAVCRARKILTTKDQEIKKIVEGLRVEIPEAQRNWKRAEEIHRAEAYNQALDDVLKAISK